MNRRENITPTTGGKNFFYFWNVIFQYCISFYIENENEFLHRRLLSITHDVTDQSNVSDAVLNQLKRLEGVVLRKHLDDDDEDDEFGNLPPKNLEDFFFFVEWQS